MAKLLYENESSEKHLSTTRKHMRRCKKFKVASKYSTSIEPLYKVLIERKKVTANKAEIREDAYDEVMFFDSELDGDIRELFNE